MASIYKRKRSKFWYVRIKQGNRWVAKATRYLVADPLATARAKVYASTISVGEVSVPQNKSTDWVVPMIENMPITTGTCERYLSAWRSVNQFMTLKKFRLDEFGPIHANLFIHWRHDVKKNLSRKKLSRNTMIQELKILKIIQRQGRLFGKMEGRPMDDYKCQQSAKRIRPELTDEEIQKCRMALMNKPSWMGVAFEISLATGCRLRECCIPTSCIDLERRTVTFPNPKGGETKAFLIPIPASILPLLTHIVESGAKVTCLMPRKASYRFRRMFDKLGMPNHCFHSLRITRVSRMRRAEVPRASAMRLVNHSSEIVHRMYDRFEMGDLRKYVDAGSTPLANGQNQTAQLLLPKSESRRIL